MKKALYILLVSLLSLNLATAQQKEVNTDLEVGTLPGSLSVSPTGAAIYSIPIDLPAGRGGMTPSLSFNYNSQGGNGLLGVGWSLGGLSAISRTGTTLYHDGVVSGVDFTDDDKIMLDGQRLIEIRTTPTETEYRTEIESFSKIIGYETAGSGHKYYKVWTKSGQIIEYGNTEDSRIQSLDNDNNQRPDILTWHVNNIKDNHGNYIELTYNELRGIGLVKKIEYTGNIKTEVLPNYSIVFEYNDREDIIKNHISGSTMELRDVLDQVIILYKDLTILKSYALHYNHSGMYSRLENITLQDSNGNMLNPTLFEWGNLSHDRAVQTPFGDTREWDHFFVDFSGDGKADIIEAQYEIYEHGDDEAKMFSTWQYRENIGNGFSLNATEFTHQIAPFFGHFLYGDFNGDGLQDLLSCAFTHERHDRMKFDMIFLANGNGFDEYSLSIDYPFSWAEINMDELPEIHVGDFDGDGISELFLSYKLITDDNNTYIYKFNGTNLIKVFESDIDFGYSKSRAALITGEFNGDGKTDLLKTSTSGGSHPPSTIHSWSQVMQVDMINQSFQGSTKNNYPTIDHRIFKGDFNGDGMTDVITYNYINEDEGWDMKCTNGDGYWRSFYTPPISVSFDPYEPEDAYLHGIIVGDFNGDGKSDIAEFEKQTNSSQYSDYTISYSNGYWFEDYTTEQIYCPEGLYINCTPYEIKHYAFKAGLDFNGDGRTDLFHSNGIYDDKIYLFDINNNHNSLLSITNGFGNQTSISYKPLTDNTIYTKGTGSQYPINDIQAPLYVVSSVTSDEELGPDLKIDYHYTGAKVHKRGKGFLGFTQTTVDNHSSNTTSTTNFSIFDENEKYYYPYVKTTEQKVTGTTDILFTSENFLNIKNTVTGYDMIFMPFVEESIAHSRDMDGSFINTTKNRINKTDIDEYGNIKKTITLVSPVNLHINDEDDSYLYKNIIETSFETPDLDNWLISLPHSIQTKKYITDQNDEDIMINYFSYHQFGSTGWPKVEFVETFPNYNLPLHTKQSFIYDDYGNTTTKTISAPNANPPLEDRITSYNYSNGYEGRFLTRKTNTINGVDYITEYDYYEDKGLLKSETFNPGEEVKSLITTYLYDTFGKLSIIKRPNGIYTKTFYDWAVNKKEANMDWWSEAIYYKYSYSIHKDFEDKDYNWMNLTLTYYDKFEREIAVVTYDQHGNPIFVLRKYDEEGLLAEISEPHFYLEQYSNTTFKYDDLGRVELTTTPTASIKTEYNGRTKTITNNNTSIWKTETVNAIGLTESIIDPAGTITYQYYSSGNIHKIVALGAETIMAYDEAGNQRLLNDPNAGITSFIYNAYGELEEQTDAKNNITNMYYDSFGRLEGKEITNVETGAFEKTAYSYQDRPDVGGFGKLRRVLGSNGINYTYAYDEISRLITKTETIDGIDYSHNYTYDPYYDKISTLEYPSDFKVKYDYLPNGFLDKIKDNSTGNMLWQPIENNGRGQLTDYDLGNGLSTHKEFDIYGYPRAILTSKEPEQPVQNLAYYFERSTGNLSLRKEVRPGNDLNENFGYDTDMLNSRLTSWQASDQQEYSIMYKPNGNIFTKSDVTIGGPLSVFLYGNDAGTHAVTTVHNPTNEYLAEAANPQSIIYTLFNKIETVSQTKIEEEEEHRYGLSYTYGPDNARKTAITTKDRRVLKTKTYIGADYEVENLEDGSIKQLHYIVGGDGLFAINVWTSSDIGESFEKRMYYIHKDYLGSYETITNDNGDIVEKLSYDPWGRKRNPVDWTYTPSPFASIFDRGYTGHEHMEAFGLINMNGRVYDPWLGRMLSPDNYVQAPTYSQNFNRYSYVLNNPLKYTDPSGEFWNLVIGAAIGGAAGYISGRAAGLRGNSLAYYTLASAGIGAITGGIGSAVGSAVSIGGSAFVSGMATGAISGAAGGFAGGFMATGINNTFYGRSDNIFVGGAKGAAIGATIGGIAGGIKGGLYNKSEGLGFFDGDVTLSEEDQIYLSMLASNDNSGGTMLPPNKISWDSKMGKKLVHLLKWMSYSNKYNDGDLDLSDAFSDIGLLDSKNIYGSNLGFSTPREGIDVNLSNDKVRTYLAVTIQKSSYNGKIHTTINVAEGRTYSNGDWVMTNNMQSYGTYTVGAPSDQYKPLYEYLFHRQY